MHLFFNSGHSSIVQVFLQYQFEAGTEPEEKELATRIIELQSAAPELLLNFFIPSLMDSSHKDKRPY